MVQHQNLFQDSNIPKSYLTQIRGFSWHNNEIKRIRSGYYSSNNFQDSNKIKSTENKAMGYLPKVLFFNTFELGAESANQVISKEALRSTVEVFSIMKLCPNEFLSIPCYHALVHYFHQNDFQGKSN
jgi:hypothetical protein